MAREITLTADDVAGLEKKLSDERSSMTPEQVTFTEILIKRGKEGQQSVAPTDVRWTWTYRF